MGRSDVGMSGRGGFGHVRAGKSCVSSVVERLPALRKRGGLGYVVVVGMRSAVVVRVDFEELECACMMELLDLRRWMDILVSYRGGILHP